jgi:hypothetical protein
MALMFVTYMLHYLDKIALGYTAVMGVQADTVGPSTYCFSRLTQSQHLYGQQYSWCSSAFYFGYIVASLPGSVGFVKIDDRIAAWRWSFIIFGLITFT